MIESYVSGISKIMVRIFMSQIQGLTHIKFECIFALESHRHSTSN